MDGLFGERQPKFDGFYRGIVVDNDDPSKAGRVKVRVMPMFEGVDEASLPWAIMADPGMGGLSDQGSIRVPGVDAHVFVFFENSDHRYPVYFAGAPAIQNNVPDVPELSRTGGDVVDGINSRTKKGVSTPSGSWDEPDSAHAAQYPDNKVMRTSKGIVVELDDTDGNVRFHIFHPSGTREEITNDGDRVQHIEGNQYTIVVGDDNIYVTGARNVTVDGDNTLYVKGNVSAKVDGNLEAEVGGDTAVTTTGDTNVTSSGNVNVVGAMINLN